MKTILVTGAGGFVGIATVRRLLADGYRVRAMTRTGTINLPSHQNLDVMTGDMKNKEDIQRCVHGVDAIVHLAARKSDEADSEAVNIDGARHLIDASTKNNVQRIINISTQSAKLSRRGTYGRTKLEADKLFTASGLNIVTLQPSVVYSDIGGGIIGTVLGMTSLPFVVPMIGSGNIHIRPIHVDDLAAIIARSLEKNEAVTKTYDVGGPDSITLLKLTKEILRRKDAKKPIVTMPLIIAMMIARMTTWMSRPPVTISNVLGAMEDVPMNIEPMLRDFGVQPRSLQSGLDRIFQNMKKESDETDVLLQYILSSWKNWKPSAKNRELYEEAVRIHEIDTAHVLDPIVLRHRFFLKAIDVASHGHGTLQEKLLVAAAVTECSPGSAEFLLPQDGGVLMMLIRSTFAGLRSIFSIILGNILKIFAPSFFRRNAGL